MRPVVAVWLPSVATIWGLPGWFAELALVGPGGPDGGCRLRGRACRAGARRSQVLAVYGARGLGGRVRVAGGTSVWAYAAPPGPRAGGYRPLAHQRSGSCAASAATT